MEISLCMIVKNEEKVLGRCLSSVAPYVDEVIVVDTGSTDGTLEIAEQFGATICHFDWCDDFSKARNFAFSKASKDYIMWLDADDYLSGSNMDKLKDLKHSLDGSYDVVSMVYSLVRDEEGLTTCGLRRNRIVKRDHQFQWIGKIHEYLDVYGNFYYSDIEVFHDKHGQYTDRNLKIYQQMKEAGEPFSPRDQFYYANELYDNGLFAEAVDQYDIFLKSGKGWVEDRKVATINLVACLSSTNQHHRIMDYILSTFKMGVPHAELCCRLAECFMREDKVHETIFWYETALRCVPSENHMALSSKIYHTFIPSIQLCVFYSRLGNYEKANYYNEMAAGYDPDSPLVKHNREFLSPLINQT